MNFASIRNSSGGSTSNNNPFNSSGHQNPQIKYIYDLPFFDRKEICRIFDENNLWETLGGGLMGYSTSDLQEFSRAVFRGGSPTDSLLTSWGNQNHTILELFTLFGKLLNTRGMKVLSKYVDPKYLSYIQDPDFHATVELVGIDPPVRPNAVEAKVQNIQEKPAEKESKGNDASISDKAKMASALAESAGLLPQIPYLELLTATNNWDRRNMLGKGGFGTVYKGVWKSTAVAIKRMEQRPNPAYVESQMKQSLGELKFLNSYRHDNILPLYGFSLEGEHPCLVYQFMTHGSLEDRLLCRQRTAPLSWHLRFQIAKGVACGIQFLHSIGTLPLIHGDIKSANILLDENFKAKVGDFGLAREMASPSSDKSYVKVSRVHGTRPYLPDEYMRSKKLSTKVDTYSFGIVLFELATGQRAYEESRPKKFLKDLVEEAEGNIEYLKDQKGGPDNPDVFHILINLGRNCIKKLAKNRPEMVQVLKALETSMPQSTAASSFRTITMTGFPYIFESPSRPGTLQIPASTSTLPRLSPEMRAGSPYLISPQGTFATLNGQSQGHQVQQRKGDSGAPVIVRKSPQPSPPLPAPSPTNHVLIHAEQNHPMNVPLEQNNHIMPLMTPMNFPPEPIPPNTSRGSPNNQNQNQPPPVNINQQLTLTVDTTNASSGGSSRTVTPVPVPETTGLVQQCPVLPVKPEALNFQQVYDFDDAYLPLVLDEHNNSDPIESVDAGFATVIPLITELGVKDGE